ncbi:MAG TPA: alginate export family protein [Longimicrobiales bacterium]
MIGRCTYALVLATALVVTNGNAQTFTGAVRLRGESWQWFDHPTAENSYNYLGALVRVAVSDQMPRLSWRIELAAPVLLGLPDDAVAPAPGGQLGAGASYWQANDSSDNVANVFLKQAYVRIGKPVAQGGHSVRAGRFEFVDGNELTPANATLAALKRDRIAHRLVGNFGWTHVQRSFDGAQYGHDRSGQNITALAVRPTRGVFDADGWGELDVALWYASYNRADKHHEWRLFATAYHDYRDDPRPVKTDNRPLAIRAADTDDISVQTVGGHFLKAIPASFGSIDVLLWGNVQLGDWGALEHRAVAFSVEAGVQPKLLSWWKPWLRAAYTLTSGDDDPGDDRHATFFPLLPTPRIYARFPFYSMMNLQDAALSLVLRPGSKLTLRTEAHWLRLAEAGDLWYAGGGAFEAETFGYAGRPSNGADDLARLFDLSADVRVNNNISINVYGALARGGDVIDRIYTDRNASFGYIELELRK